MCTNGCLFVHPSTLPLQHYTTSTGSGIAGLLAKDFKYKRWVPVGKITRQKLQGYRWVPVYSPLYTSTAYYTTSNLCLVYAMQVYLQKDSKYKDESLFVYHLQNKPQSIGQLNIAIYRLIFEQNRQPKWHCRMYALRAIPDTCWDYGSPWLHMQYSWGLPCYLRLDKPTSLIPVP